MRDRKLLILYKASCQLINVILSALNDTLIVGELFCYVEKVLPCVNHILLSKLIYME
jgi:hypothetical protein